MTLIERVKSLCDRDHTNLSSLEKELNFANGSLREGDTPKSIRSDRVLKIAQRFNVSTDWLITGKDSIMSDEDRKLLFLFHDLNAEGKDQIITYIKFIGTQDIYKKSRTTEVV